MTKRVRRGLAALLTAAVLLGLCLTPALAAGSNVKVLGTNGTVTVGVRGKNQMVYTTDGVTWQAGSFPAMAGKADYNIQCGCYQDGLFLVYTFQPYSSAPSYVSSDGVNWQTAQAGTSYPTFTWGSTQAGPYRFTYDQGEIWLSNEAGVTAKLEGLYAAIAAKGMYAENLQAYYVPQGVRLVCYGRYDTDGSFRYETTYTTAQLNALLANPPAPDPVSGSGLDLWSVSSSGSVAVGMGLDSKGMAFYGYTRDGVNWYPYEPTPWSGAMDDLKLLPYNGRSFVMVGVHSGAVHLSTDGVHWRSLDSGDLPWLDGGSVSLPQVDYTFVWTGSGYVMCQKVVSRGGMFGSSAGESSPRNSLVTLLDEALQVVWEHDFGQQVTGVGYQGNVYYAQTADGVVHVSGEGAVWKDSGLTAIPAAALPAQHPLPTGTGSTGGATGSTGAIQVTLDGVPIAFPIDPYQVSGCTMAPLRDLAGAVGLSFAYDGATGTAVCQGEGITLWVQEGSTVATLNGASRTWLAVPAQMHQWRLCVPVRFFAEAVGLDVTWDSVSQTFAMHTPAGG
jgi:hypothetical protein